MLYQIKDGTVSAGGQTILSLVDFYIKEKEKIAVVGKNGAGKTTLLRLLAGELTPDRDVDREGTERKSPAVIAETLCRKRQLSGAVRYFFRRTYSGGGRAGGICNTGTSRRTGNPGI